MQSAWSTSDAWIFAAIGGSGSSGPVGQQTLSEVIATADRINHAIPTEDEFARAIARLTAGGVVDTNEDGSRYWLTDAGLQLHRRWQDGLFSWNVILPGLRKLGTPSDTRWSLPHGAFARATEEHLKRAEEIVRRLTRR